MKTLLICRFFFTFIEILNCKSEIAEIFRPASRVLEYFDLLAEWPDSWNISTCWRSGQIAGICQPASEVVILLEYFDLLVECHMLEYLIKTGILKYCPAQVDLV